MDGDAGDPVAALLDLARVKAGIGIWMPTAWTCSWSARAQRTARRPVERREHTVAGEIRDAAAVGAHLAPRDLLVRVEKRPPAAISEPGGAPRRLDDVSEEDRGEHAVDPVRGPRSRDELLDLVDDGVDTSLIAAVVGARHLDELRSRDRVRDRLPAGGAEEAVPPGDDQRRHADGRKGPP